MRTEIIPFQSSHLPDAALLMAKRHQRNRVAEPALPARFEDAAVTSVAIETIWHKPGARGVVALHNGRVIAYLIAIPKIEATWGRTMWINQAGHAIDPEYGMELYRDLYAAASSDWVAAGYFYHYILVPADDRSTLDAWFSLSFGQEQAHAIRETDQDVSQAASKASSLEVRRAMLADREGMLQLMHIVRRYQSRSPVYAPLLPENLETLASDVDGLLTDENIIPWLALRDRRVVGFQLYEPAPPAPDILYIPEHCVELALATTAEDEQGHGVGSTITRHAFAWAREAGYTHCIVDWRVTNQLSSRFWPRQGFRPVVYRLSRRIDERIAWANG